MVIAVAEGFPRLSPHGRGRGRLYFNKKPMLTRKAQLHFQAPESRDARARETISFQKNFFFA